MIVWSLGFLIGLDDRTKRVSEPSGGKSMFLVDPEHLFGSAKFRGYHTNWVGCESFKFGGGGCPFRGCKLLSNCYNPF